MISFQMDGQPLLITPELVEKYSRPGPRYTSYPTAPHWSKMFGPTDFERALEQSNQGVKPLSLYFHLPFCEERCTFCACSVVATKQRHVVEPYLKALKKEIEMVAKLVDLKRAVEQLHWGGGTPTYLNEKQIEELYTHITKYFKFSPTAEVSIEIDPRVTTKNQLKTLRRLGFNRVSFGLQDFEPIVQEEAGRIQSEEETSEAVAICRELKYQSLNIDLVYGLPKQSEKSFQKTLEKISHLDPDRIALFNFAYVPWMHPHQKKILESDLPNPQTKLKMFCEAIEFFQKRNYEFIGLDHFAKKKDELTQAKKEGSMYRNFQGYTTKAACDLIGIGVTAISFVNGCFAQNEKKLKTYQQKVSSGAFATNQGLQLKEDDGIRQWVIRELFCHQTINKMKFEETFSKNFDVYFAKEMRTLKYFELDHLIRMHKSKIEITSLGRLFIRNIGMIFDIYLKDNETKFSKTV